MCVYPLTVPISSLSISLPPGSWPICLPGLRAWSHRSGPCQPHWNISVCVCVCLDRGVGMRKNESVHVHLLQSRCIVWQITPDLSPRGGSVLMYMWIALVTNYRCTVFICICLWSCTGFCACMRPHMSASIFRRNAWLPSCEGTLPPPFPPSSFSEPDGVPGSPLTPCCTVTDGTGQTHHPPAIVPWWASDTTQTHSLTELPPRTWASRAP